jgi:hypothetical protein
MCYFSQDNMESMGNYVGYSLSYLWNYTKNVYEKNKTRYFL